MVKWFRLAYESYFNHHKVSIIWANFKTSWYRHRTFEIMKTSFKKTKRCLYLCIFVPFSILRFIRWDAAFPGAMLPPTQTWLVQKSNFSPLMGLFNTTRSVCVYVLCLCALLMFDVLQIGSFEAHGWHPTTCNTSMCRTLIRFWVGSHKQFMIQCRASIEWTPGILPTLVPCICSSRTLRRVANIFTSRLRHGQ